MLLISGALDIANTRAPNNWYVTGNGYYSVTANVSSIFWDIHQKRCFVGRARNLLADSSAVFMREIVRSCRGEKQITRQMPGSPWTVMRSLSLLFSTTVAGKAQRSRCRRRTCLHTPDCMRRLLVRSPDTDNNSDHRTAELLG